MAQEETYAGWTGYLVLMRQEGEQCPYPLDYAEDGAGNMIRRNGIIFIDSGFNAPYDSWANIAAAIIAGNETSWVFHLGSGEGRLYNDPAAADEYWTPQQMAIGRVRNFKPSMERPVVADYSIGANQPQSLTAQPYSNSFNFEKTYVDKRRWTDGPPLPSESTAKAIDRQFALMGTGLVIVDNFINTLKQYYWLVIHYVRDPNASDGDLTNVARTLLWPCSKFETVSVDHQNDRIIACSLSGKGTFCRDIPHDEDTSLHYTHNYTP